ncbi:MAG: monovalent cation/H(+) antiporter subunit G [SAR324 cluster bacterium]|nr:monovalent cation/H(+) antiporter subunit G [SAR324 cluster bacterium]
MYEIALEYLGATLMLLGAAILAISSFGLFKFQSLNNKIQAGGIASSIALPLMLVGLSVVHPPAGGLCFTLLVFDLFVSPLASHLLAKAGSKIT